MEAEGSEGTVLEPDAGTLDLQSEVVPTSMDTQETDKSNEKDITLEILTNQKNVSDGETDKEQQVDSIDNSTNTIDVPENPSSEDAGVDAIDLPESSAEAEEEDPLAEVDAAIADSEITEKIPSMSLEQESEGFFIDVSTGEGETQKIIKVEVMSSPVVKPFLGGFRHRLTGIEFHNASVQTFPKKIISSGIPKFDRDTQTVTTRNQFQQTHNNTSTQMTKPGCYVSNVTDKIIIPGKYFTADEREALILEKVIILQSYWRRWLAKRYVERLIEDRDMRVAWEKQQADQKEQDRVARVRKEFERRMKPKTKEDFDLLYAALEKWRKEEMERINEKRSGPERKAALIGLLEQEAYLIQSIERHRSNANDTNSKENVRNFLNKAASPKKWRAYDGKMTEMDTPFTLRAQELRDLYTSLEMNHLTQDERLDVLITLKHTVKEHECKLTQELMELIDREADLLTRGIKVANLEGLRKRILALYLQYCKTPLFNPEVARLLKVPQDPSTLRKDIYFCPSCNAYLASSAFPIASNSRIVGRCKKCMKLDNDARLRNDFTKIRAMMLQLRHSEEAYDDGSRVAFTIQYADLQFLVENIWNSQSALSGIDDISELVLVRWNRFEHWSPWNCVLFTKEEASAHTRLDNVVEAYGRIFVGKVHHRHVLARNYFSKLTQITADAYDENGKQKNSKSREKKVKQAKLSQQQTSVTLEA